MMTHDCVIDHEILPFLPETRPVGISIAVDGFGPVRTHVRLNPRPATEVRVRQNEGPGAIVKVEAITADGAAHTWWQGRDPFVAPATKGFAWFAVRVPPTTYSVAKVRLTLDLAAVPGWNQIDAVQIVGAR